MWNIKSNLALIVGIILMGGCVTQASALPFPSQSFDPCERIEGQWLGTYKFLNASNYLFIWNADATTTRQNSNVQIRMTISNCRTARGEHCHHSHPSTYLITGSCKDGKLLLSFGGVNTFGSMSEDTIDFRNYNNHVVLHKLP